MPAAGMEFGLGQPAVTVKIGVGENLIGGEPPGADKFGGVLIDTFAAAAKLPANALAAGYDGKAGLAPLFGDQATFLAAGEKLREQIAK